MGIPDGSLEGKEEAELGLVDALKLADFDKRYPVKAGEEQNCIVINRKNYASLALLNALREADNLSFQLFWEHPFTIVSHNNLPGPMSSGADWGSLETLFRDLCHNLGDKGGEELFLRAIEYNSEVSFENGCRLLHKFGFHADQKDGRRALNRYQTYKSDLKEVVDSFDPEDPTVDIDKATKDNARVKIAMKLGMSEAEAKALPPPDFFDDKISREQFFDDELWKLLEENPRALIELTSDPFVRRVLVPKGMEKKGYYVGRMPALKQKLQELFAELDVI